MIFGNEYDLSLYYMLKVNNLYGRKAIGFIKELPEEFLENIKATYRNGNCHNAGMYDDLSPFYNIQSEMDPSIYYKFYFMCKDLYIYKRQIVDGVSKDIFSLILSPNDPNDFIQLEKAKEKTLGSICVGEYPTMNFKEVDYSLKKTSFGYTLEHTYILLSNFIEIKSGRLTSINNMPDELFRENPQQKKLKKIPPK